LELELAELTYGFTLSIELKMWGHKYLFKPTDMVSLTIDPRKTNNYPCFSIEPIDIKYYKQHT